jgi:hypothetical protein
MFIRSAQRAELHSSELAAIAYRDVLFELYACVRVVVFAMSNARHNACMIDRTTSFSGPNATSFVGRYVSFASEPREAAVSTT